MNANAYGGELARVLEWVDVVGPGGTERRAPDQLGFAYRRSSLGPGEVVARASFALHEAASDEVKATLADMRARRKAAQPSGIKTFGSTFKNPDPTRVPRAAARASCSMRRAAGGCASAAPGSRPSMRTSSRTTATRARQTSSRLWPRAAGACRSASGWRSSLRYRCSGRSSCRPRGAGRDNQATAAGPDSGAARRRRRARGGWRRVVVGARLLARSSAEGHDQRRLRTRLRPYPFGPDSLRAQHDHARRPDRPAAHRGGSVPGGQGRAGEHPVPPRHAHPGHRASPGRRAHRRRPVGRGQRRRNPAPERLDPFVAGDPGAPASRRRAGHRPRHPRLARAALRHLPSPRWRGSRRSPRTRPTGLSRSCARAPASTSATTRT